jgi:hypothetical protein
LISLVSGGEAEVLSFINREITEELFLDYKGSADNASGTSPNNQDKAKLARALSGLENSEGAQLFGALTAVALRYAEISPSGRSTFSTRTEFVRRGTRRVATKAKLCQRGVRARLRVRRLSYTALASRGPGPQNQFRGDREGGPA